MGNTVSEDLIFEAVATGGERKGEHFTAAQNFSSYTEINPREVKVGDSIIIASFGSVGTAGTEWHFIEFVRSDAIIILALIFAVLLIAFGRLKGLKTVFSLVLTVAAVIFVFIPAVLSGANIYFYAVAVCVYIIVMTMLITSGLSPMSISAILGCVGGVLISLSLTLIMDSFIHITSNANELSLYLMNIGDGLDVRAIIFASIIIGSVGAVMDVAVDIAASLKELTLKLKTPTRKELFSSGLNIGRDVIGTMANTLVLAYIGGSMSSLLLYFYNNMTNAVYLFNVEIIVIEMLNILVGSIGILLTLPLTALISAYIYTLEPMRLRILREAEEGSAAKLDTDTGTKKISGILQKAKGYVKKSPTSANDDFSSMLDSAGEFDSGKDS